MKSFADTSFFLLFEEIIRRDNPKRDDIWTAVGVTWRHGRHTFESEKYGFAIDAYEATRPGKNEWTLLITKEHWWAGKRGDVVKTTQWAKPIKGSRQAVLQWLRQRQNELGM
jgi:hypothetical protein